MDQPLFIDRLQSILPPKCHFSFVKKCKFREKFCHKSRILPVFRHPKMAPFQQCITVTAVNLFYEVLPKQFEAFGFHFSQGKKQVTAEYWVSLSSKGFCRHKCHFSFVKKCKFRQKICHKSRILPVIVAYYSLFIKFRQISSKINIFVDGQFSSFRQFSVKNEILWSLFIEYRIVTYLHL